jgi:hypothetical protein
MPHVSDGIPVYFCNFPHRTNRFPESHLEEPLSDRLYREFIQRQPSCLTGRFAEYVDGEGRNPACHVRRANKFGTGFKAEYSCVALTHQEHDIQSRLGELACLKEFLPAVQVAEMFDGVSYEVSVLKAKVWFDEQVAIYFERWCETLKHATSSWEQLQEV